MALEFCDAFKVAANDALIASKYSGATCRLYQNAATVSHTNTIGDFVEATFDGYAPISLSSWPGSTLDGSFNAVSTHPSVTFTQTGIGTINTVYGVFVTDAFGTTLIGAEANPAGPQMMDATGLTYVVGVTVGDNNQSPP